MTDCGIHEAALSWQDFWRTASMASAAALTDAAADAAGGGDLDSALALVRRALALAPQSVPALVCLGNVLAARARDRITRQKSGRTKT